MTAPTPSAERRLRGADYLVLVTLSAALYGAAAFSGRPLSVHEARVPELAREMVRGQSDWILPQSGGRPWLERPPLPHWFTAGSMKIFGRSDSLWAARLPAAVMGCAIVLLGTWMSARWFGRGVGLLCGVALATTYELYQYATLAEDDIYLAAVAVSCMSLFVKTEWTSAGLRVVADDPGDGPRHAHSTWLAAFFRWRPWPTVLFFVLLGLTNLAKGPLVGALPVVAAIGVYLLWDRDARRIRHYTWFWGWLIFLVLTVVWPWWALRHYPDLADNWRFDYLQKVEGGRPGAEAAAELWNKPAWYYLAQLPGALAPWTWATLIGLLATARRAWRAPGSAERFLWCWAWMGLIVLSLPARKHHHYLVPIVTPWAIFAGLGLAQVGRLLTRADAPTDARRGTGRIIAALLVFGLPGVVALFLWRHRLPGDISSAALLSGTWLLCLAVACVGVTRRRLAWLVAAVVVGFVACAAWVQFAVAGRDPVTVAEGRFLRDVEAKVPPGEPILVNADIGSLRCFGVQFRLRREQRLLHNLSFLRDRDITAPTVYLVTQARDQSTLERFGETQPLAQASTFRPKESKEHQLTLFRVTFFPELSRYPRPPYVGVMQAMGRKKGPWCGQDWQATSP